MAKKTSSGPGLDPEALYRVTLLRVVPTPAFTYRPQDEHRMTGAQLASLAETAGAAVEEIAIFAPEVDRANG